MPSDAGDKEAVRIVVLDRNFHLECFRCEVRTFCGLGLHSALMLLIRQREVHPACKIPDVAVLKRCSLGTMSNLE